MDRATAWTVADGASPAPSSASADHPHPNSAAPNSARDSTPADTLYLQSDTGPDAHHDPAPPRSDWCPLPRDHPRRWTPARVRLFMETLADTGIVARAADVAGMSREAAYAFRRRGDGPGRAFDRAWRAALAAGAQRLEEVAFERALTGTVDTVYDAEGRPTAYRRRMNDRLLMYMLTHHRRATYAAGAGTGATARDADDVAEQAALQAAAAREEDEAARALPALINHFARAERRVETGHVPRTRPPKPAETQVLRPSELWLEDTLARVCAEQAWPEGTSAAAFFGGAAELDDHFDDDLEDDDLEDDNLEDDNLEDDDFEDDDFEDDDFEDHDARGDGHGDVDPEDDEREDVDLKAGDPEGRRSGGMRCGRG